MIAKDSSFVFLLGVSCSTGSTRRVCSEAQWSSVHRGLRSARVEMTFSGNRGKSIGSRAVSPSIGAVSGYTLAQPVLATSRVLRLGATLVARLRYRCCLSVSKSLALHFCCLRLAVLVPHEPCVCQC